jgi:DNA-binding response OmpR family regulator
VLFVDPLREIRVGSKHRGRFIRPTSQRGIGEVRVRLDLLKEVWGHSSSVLTRTVDTHVAELRRKLEDDASRPRHILTARKAGYRLQRETD